MSEPSDLDIFPHRERRKDIVDLRNEGHTARDESACPKGPDALTTQQHIAAVDRNEAEDRLSSPWLGDTAPRSRSTDTVTVFFFQQPQPHQNLPVRCNEQARASFAAMRDPIPLRQGKDVAGTP